MRRWQMEPWMSPIIEEYCGNDMKKLRRICKKFIVKANIPEMNWDELYSDAQKVLMESLMRYDKSRACTFNTFLVRNIENSLREWVRDSLREKRCNVLTEKGKIVLDDVGDPIPIPNVSLDYVFEDGHDVSEKVGSEFNLEEEVLLGLGFLSDPMWISYLSALSDVQKRMVVLISNDQNKNEIMFSLNLSDKEFEENMASIRSHENTKVILQSRKRI